MDSATKEKIINIQVTSKDVRDQLGKLISGTPYKEEILDTLMYSICREDPGLENLYKSLLGIDFEPIHHLGKEFYVKIHNLGTWQFDRTATEASDLIFQGRLLVKILGRNKHSATPYTVSFEAVEGSVIKKYTYKVSEHVLEEKDSIELPPF